jgi:hypothetical protein
MQLDSTRIAIRERTLAETFDLALQVLREFFGPIVLLLLLAIVPLAVLNYLLVGWMVPTEFEDELVGWRFGWNMLALVYLEAPLASVFVLAYLGPAVFREEKSSRQVMQDALRALPQLFLCQFLIRGILPGWLLYLAVDRFAFDGFIEGFLLTCLLMYVTFMRAIRPYINEIILLEKNPLRARTPQTITVNRRSAHLHGPYASDLIARWIVGAMVSVLLFFLALTTLTIVRGVLTSDWPFYAELMPSFVWTWDVDWFDLQVILPAAMWLVVGFTTVVRFLSYLDLRIRHEGWEVELLMRAEAMRLATQVQ